MPIYIVIGTRAQLIKMAPIMLALETAEIPYHFIYSQQHKNTIDDLINNFSIKTSYRNIVSTKEEASSIPLFMNWGLKMLMMLFNPFSRRKVFPDGKGLVLTHGDTATTAWAAIFGKLSGSKVMHIESGLRSFNLLNPFPEELLRLVTFAFTDIYICPNDEAIQNLKTSKGIKIDTQINTMYEALIFALHQLSHMEQSPSSHIKTPDAFAIVSLHRYENIYNESSLKFIVSLLKEISGTIDLLMIAHPSMEKKLRMYNLYDELNNEKKISIMPRQDFFTFVSLTQKASFVITDGGSNQEEMSYIGKPTLLFRNATERTEGLGRNVVLSKFDKQTIDHFIKNYNEFSFPPIDYRNNAPSKIILETIKRFI